SHFAPDYMMQALTIYRDIFRPSEALQSPYAMLGVNIIAADSNEEAYMLATSQQQQLISLRRTEPTQRKPPVNDIEQVATPSEVNAVNRTLGSSTTIVGDKIEVKRKVEQLLEETKAEELIINSQIFNHKNRLKSYEIVSQLME